MTETYWFTARAGSVLTEWPGGALPQGVLELHPVHRARIHLFSGDTKELGPDDDLEAMRREAQGLHWSARDGRRNPRA